MRVELSQVVISPVASMKEALECINRNEVGIALAVGVSGELLGTITDGDVRRALLRGVALENSISEVLNPNAFVVPETFTAESIAGFMRANHVRHMPLVDEAGHVTGLEVLATSIFKEQDAPVAVLMAGGEGVRLRPLTDTTPKPMLKVAGRPLLEIVLTSLQDVGFRRVFMNVRYLGYMIEDYFGDGSKWGVEIHYLREPHPLGTAGGLSMIPRELRPANAFVVINADILTRLNFAVFREFHLAGEYGITLCCRPYEVRIPFGYPVINGDLVADFKEKPIVTHLVNSGIYCLDPDLLDEIPANQMFDMPDLVRRACRSGRRVGVFPLREPFHEIGRVESYTAAEDFYQRHFAAASRE